MPDVVVLTEKQLRAAVTMDAAVVDAVENAFRWIAEGKVEMPPIMHIEVAEGPGDVDIKSAYARGLPSFAVKIGAGFFNNHKLGLPNGPASVVLVSARTGFVEAVLLDNGYLTDARTGAAGAVAAKHMAKKGAARLGIIGTGMQARFQAEAVKLVRPLASCAVWGRDDAKARAFAEEMTGKLGIGVTVARSAEALVKECDLVVTTTPAKAPVVRAAWLHPGLHITAMGADLADKQELEAECLERADRVVVDRRSQCERMGELHHALKKGLKVEAVELGEVCLGRVPGRTNDTEITICDLTGTGAQDTAIAALAFQRAKSAGTTIKN